jgi:predicted ferric reductase
MISQDTASINFPHQCGQFVLLTLGAALRLSRHFPDTIAVSERANDGDWSPLGGAA